jgi:hypothetical protein
VRVGEDPLEGRLVVDLDPFLLVEAIAALGLHGDDADALTCRVGDRFADRFLVVLEIVVGGQHDVVDAGVDRRADHVRLVAVGRGAEEARLALLFGLDQRFHDGLIGSHRRAVAAVEVEDVDVVGAQPLEAGLEQFEEALLGRRRGPCGGFVREDSVVAIAGEVHLGGDGDRIPVAALLDDFADHLLALATQVAVGGVEVVETEVEGPVEELGVVGVHHPEADQRDLQTRSPEDPVLDLRCRRLVLGRCRLPRAGPRVSGQVEPGRDHAGRRTTDEPPPADALLLHEPPPSQIAVSAIEPGPYFGDIPDVSSNSTGEKDRCVSKVVKGGEGCLL